MHADARMVEKDVDIWLTEADKSNPKALAEARIQNIEKIIQQGLGNNSAWRVFRNSYLFNVVLYENLIII
jgi:hypothetical protein